MPVPPYDTDFATPRNFTRDVAAVAATGTFAVMVARAADGFGFRITSAQLITDATYAADAANFYVLTLVHNVTTIASWSTQTAAQGALTALVTNEMILSADAGINRVVLPGETLTWVLTKNASAANISARVVVHGRFV